MIKIISVNDEKRTMQVCVISKEMKNKKLVTVSQTKHLVWIEHTWRDSKGNIIKIGETNYVA